MNDNFITALKSNENSFSINKKCSIEFINNDNDIQEYIKQECSSDELEAIIEKEPFYKVVENNRTVIYSTSSLLKKTNKVISESIELTVWSSVLLFGPIWVESFMISNYDRAILVDILFCSIFILSIISTLSWGLIKSLRNIRKYKKIKNYILKHSDNFLNYKKSEELKKINEHNSKITFVLK